MLFILHIILIIRNIQQYISIFMTTLLLILLNNLAICTYFSVHCEVAKFPLRALLETKRPTNRSCIATTINCAISRQTTSQDVCMVSTAVSIFYFHSPHHIKCLLVAALQNSRAQRIYNKRTS